MVACTPVVVSHAPIPGPRVFQSLHFEPLPTSLFHVVTQTLYSAVDSSLLCLIYTPRKKGDFSCPRCWLRGEVNQSARTVVFPPLQTPQPRSPFNKEGNVFLGCPVYDGRLFCRAGDQARRLQGVKHSTLKPVRIVRRRVW